MKKTSFLFTLIIFGLISLAFSQEKKSSNAISLDWGLQQTLDQPQGPTYSAFGGSNFTNGSQTLVGDRANNAVYYYSLNINSAKWELQQTITMLNPIDFGFCVYIANNMAFISAPTENEKRGAVYIYNYNLNTDLWEYSQKITLAQGDPNDLFGRSISVDNNVAVIGAATQDLSGKAGDAYVFINNGTSWVQDCKITCTNKVIGDRFGYRVSIDGYNIAVSAIFHNVRGSVFLFRYDPTSHSTVIGPEIVPPTEGNPNAFGQSVKIKGNLLLIGSSGTNSEGHVYSYNKLTDPTYSNPQHLHGNSPQIGFDRYGWNLDFDDNTLVVGAPIEGAPLNNNSFGSTYFYKRSGNTWIFEQKEKVSCSGLTGMYFGDWVSISQNYIVVGQSFQMNSYWKNELNGASSHAFIYKRGLGFSVDAGENQTICPGESHKLGSDPTANYGNKEYIYHWSDHNEWTSNASNPTVSPTVTTTYYLCVTDCNGNGNTLCDEVTLTVGCKFPISLDVRLPNSIDVSAENMVTSGLGHNNGIGINGNFFECKPHAGFGCKYLIKFNNSGCIDWLHLFSTESYEVQNQNYQKVKTDDEGNTYYSIFDCASFFESDFESSYPGYNPDFTFVYLSKFNKDGKIIFQNFIPVYNFNPCNRGNMIAENDGVLLCVPALKPFIYKDIKLGPGIVIMRFTPYGELIWAKTIESSLYNEIFYIAWSKKPNGNYLCFNNNFPSSNSMVEIQEFDKATGEKIRIDQLHLINDNYLPITEVDYDGKHNYFIKYAKGYDYPPPFKFIYRKIVDNGTNYTLSGKLLEYTTTNNDDYRQYEEYPDQMSINLNNLYINIDPHYWHPSILQKFDFNFGLQYSINFENGLLLSGVDNDLNNSGFAHEGSGKLIPFNITTGELGCVNPKIMMTSDNEKSSTETFLSHGLQVFPNPTTGIINIVNQDKSLENTEIILFSMEGKELSKERITNKVSSYSIDLSGKMPGLFMLRINQGNNSTNFKIIKN
jgi:hypothetical protein